MTTPEPVEIARLRAKLRPGSMLSARKKADLRRQIAEWEAEQVAEK